MLKVTQLDTLCPPKQCQLILKTQLMFYLKHIWLISLINLGTQLQRTELKLLPIMALK